MWIEVVGLGGVILLALISAILGIDGLLNRRGPSRRYVRLLLIACVLLALAALLGVHALYGWRTA